LRPLVRRSQIEIFHLSRMSIAEQGGAQPGEFRRTTITFPQRRRGPPAAPCQCFVTYGRLHILSLRRAMLLQFGHLLHEIWLDLSLAYSNDVD
jgi:hypothetical protein